MIYIIIFNIISLEKDRGWKLKKKKKENGLHKNLSGGFKPIREDPDASIKRDFLWKSQWTVKNCRKQFLWKVSRS